VALSIINLTTSNTHYYTTALYYMANRAEWLQSDETTLHGALQQHMKPMQIWKSIPTMQKFTISQIRAKINNLKRKQRDPKHQAQQKVVDRLKKYKLVDESADDDSQHSDSNSDQEGDIESKEFANDESAEEPPLKRRRVVKQEEPYK
jgi:hypothetical protein